MLVGILVSMLIILSALAAVFLFYPALRGAGKPITLARNQDRVAVYETRRAELAEDHANGMLDQAQYKALQEELDRQLLAETDTAEKTMEARGRLDWRWSAATLAGMLILAALIYWPVGAHDSYNLYQKSQVSERSEADFLAYLSALEDYVEGQRSPDIDTLYMLADGYAEAQRYQDAIDMLGRVASELRALGDYDPEDLSVVLSSRAQLRYTLNERQLTDAVEADFDEALRLDPFNAQAMATLGVAYMNAGEYDDAITLWERFLDVAPADSRTREAVTGALAQARRLSGEASEPDDASRPGVQVLFSALPDDLAPEAQVYIVARPAGGELPVAIQRYRVADLPLALRLTDQDRNPDMAPLTDHEQVEVVAFVTPEGAPVSEATHRSEVMRVPTSGDEAVVSLVIEPI